MSIIYILIPIAILLTSLGIYLFFWAVKTEQFDDLEKQGMSILFDDEQQEDPRTPDEPSESGESEEDNGSSEQETDTEQPQKTQE